MITIKEKTVQEWIPIEKIEEGGFLKLKNGKIIKIIKIDPINYNLKSDLEKEAILNSYKIFLKTCNFNLQILIQSNKKDLSHHIKKIQEKNKKNKKMEDLANKYVEYIKKFNSSKKTSSKNFYIIISKNIKEIENLNSKEIIQNELNENYFKIKECLARVGNDVREVNNKKENLQILNSFFNARKFLQ